MKKDTEKDQHFLIDENVLRNEIKAASIKKSDKIIEIGCGAGFLTKHLINHASKVLGFELDERYKSILNKLDKENLDVRYENALNYSWRGYNKIVSNIPYSISEPLLLKSIDEGIQELILIVGENFKNLLEDKTTKIGLLASVYYDFWALEKVGREKFDPIPRVDSWLIKLRRKKVNSMEKDLQKFLEYDGKIKNSLINLFISKGKTKREAKSEIRTFGFNELFLNKPVKRISAKGILMVKDVLDKLY